VNASIASTNGESDLLSAIYSLRAVRVYKNTPIPPQDLDTILRAATRACSNGNTQPWEFLVLRDHGIKDIIRSKLRAVLKDLDKERLVPVAKSVDGVGRSITGHASIEGMPDVPVIVLVFWNPDRGIRFRGEYESNPDGTLRESKFFPGGRGSSVFQACQNMMLTAHSLGISSLFTTAMGFCAADIKSLLGVPPRMFFEAAIYLGYAQEKLGRGRRRPLEDVAHVDSWNNSYSLDALSRPVGGRPGNT